MSAEKNAFIVTPASSSTLVERPRWRAARQRVDDADGGERADEACGSGGGDAGPRERPAERDRQHRTERRAGRHAQRERRRQWIAEQPLKDDACGREQRSDERARQGAWQPRDEEDLRVDVIGRTECCDRTPAAG